MHAIIEIVTASHVNAYPINAFHMNATHVNASHIEIFIASHMNHIAYECKSHVNAYPHMNALPSTCLLDFIKLRFSLISCKLISYVSERWGAGVETQKNVEGEIGGWGRVPFNETYAPSLSTIYDGA